MHLVQLRSIIPSTYGVLFFGTPHVESNGTEMAKLLIRICSPFVNNVTILEQLGRDSEPLRQLMEQYLPISPNLTAVHFYETYETRLPGGKSMLVRYPRTLLPTAHS
jgi:hypothetical protein